MRLFTDMVSVNNLILINLVKDTIVGLYTFDQA